MGMLLKFIGRKPKTISGFLIPEDKIPAEYFFDPCCEVRPEHAQILLARHPELFVRVEDPSPEEKTIPGEDGSGSLPENRAPGNPPPTAPVDPPREVKAKEPEPERKDSAPRRKAKTQRSNAQPTEDSETSPPVKESKGASPQAEEGHTDITNEIIEAFYRLRLSGNQWRILWVIVRQTYGWKKKTDKISFSFFERKTGLERRNIARALKDMLKRKIIVKNDNTFITTYGFQKDYTKWKPLSKMTTTKETQKKLSLGEISDEISSLTQRLFPTGRERELFDQVTKAISSTRKTGKVSPSIILAQLKAWEKYPLPQVHGGIQTYLRKEYQREGKGEKYLLGIIRNYQP
jgi:phage replication O-like protein O